ncbi:MAG: porin family protein [Rickettsiales bacterium]|jgi:opacity protein-like surface antigen|nr:porin family protein [Rickettsiales bacterium]
MKKLLIIGIIAFTAASAGAVEVKSYISEKISYGITYAKNAETYPSLIGVLMKGSDESDQVLGNKLAVGFSVPTEAIFGSVRAEFEFGVNGSSKYTIENKTVPGTSLDAKFKSQTYMLNAYYDVETGSAFVPYIGAGAGFAKIDGSTSFSGSTVDFDQNKFTWNAGLGVAYSINDNLSLDIGYRYASLGTVKGATYHVGSGNYITEKATLSSHEVLLGARYEF